MAHDGGTLRRVGIVTPLLAELAAVVRAAGLAPSDGVTPFSHGGVVGSWNVRCGLLGVGPQRAERETRRLLEAGALDHVMVVGIAGGLGVDLRVGDLVVPERVTLSPDGPTYVARPLPPRVACGSMLTSAAVLSGAPQWRAARAAGYTAVDMEAAGVARACQDAGVDWSVYRGISDLVAHGLVDAAVVGLTAPDGSTDTRAVAAYLARDPRRVARLVRLGRGLRLAARVAAEAAVADLG